MLNIGIIRRSARHQQITTKQSQRITNWLQWSEMQKCNIIKSDKSVACSSCWQFFFLFRWIFLNVNVWCENNLLKVEFKWKPYQRTKKKTKIRSDLTLWRIINTQHPMNWACIWSKMPAISERKDRFNKKNLVCEWKWLIRYIIWNELKCNTEKITVHCSLFIYPKIKQHE